MKILTAGFVTLLLFYSASGQAAPSAAKPTPAQAASSSSKYPNARKQADQLAEAILVGDYEKAADLTYPKLVELIGGRAKFIAGLERSMKEIQSDTFRAISTVAGDAIDVIEVGSDVYAIIPTTMKFKVPEGVLVAQAAMIGFSNDRGENWTFVDAGKGMSLPHKKMLFPAIADRLKLPEEKRPVLERTP